MKVLICILLILPIAYIDNSRTELFNTINNNIKEEIHSPVSNFTKNSIAQLFNLSNDYIACRNCFQKKCDNQTAETCEKCIPGFFGDFCNTSCPDRCAKNLGCNFRSGLCTACILGYRGPRCQEECPDGFYGEECRRKCSVGCRHDKCRSENGFCAQGCRNGYLGIRCDVKCPRGKFGRDCLAKCSSTCLGKTVCNFDTGACPHGCEVGFFGRRCTKICPSGKYGKGCNFDCSQSCNDQTCDAFTGQCFSCIPGFEGLLCELNSSNIILTSNFNESLSELHDIEEALNSPKLLFASILGLVCLGVMTWGLIGMVTYYKHKIIADQARKRGRPIPKTFSKMPTWKGKFANAYSGQQMYENIKTNRFPKRRRRQCVKRKRKAEDYQEESENTLDVWPSLSNENEIGEALKFAKPSKLSKSSPKYLEQSSVIDYNKGQGDTQSEDDPLQDIKLTTDGYESESKRHSSYQNASTGIISYDAFSTDEPSFFMLRAGHSGTDATRIVPPEGATNGFATLVQRADVQLEAGPGAAFDSLTKGSQRSSEPRVSTEKSEAVEESTFETNTDKSSVTTTSSSSTTTAATTSTTVTTHVLLTSAESASPTSSASSSPTSETTTAASTKATTTATTTESDDDTTNLEKSSSDTSTTHVNITDAYSSSSRSKVWIRRGRRQRRKQNQYKHRNADQKQIPIDEITPRYGEMYSYSLPFQGKIKQYATNQRSLPSNLSNASLKWPLATVPVKTKSGGRELLQQPLQSLDKRTATIPKTLNYDPSPLSPRLPQRSSLKSAIHSGALTSTYTNSSVRFSDVETRYEDTIPYYTSRSAISGQEQHVPLLERATATLKRFFAFQKRELDIASTEAQMIPLQDMSREDSTIAMGSPLASQFMLSRLELWNEKQPVVEQRKVWPYTQTPAMKYSQQNTKPPRFLNRPPVIKHPKRNIGPSQLPKAPLDNPRNKFSRFTEESSSTLATSAFSSSAGISRTGSNFSSSDQDASSSKPTSQTSSTRPSSSSRSRSITKSIDLSSTHQRTSTKTLTKSIRPISTTKKGHYSSSKTLTPQTSTYS